MRSRCVRVPKAEGEAARRWLMDKGLLRTNLRIVCDASHLLIPVRDGEVPFDTAEGDFTEMEQMPKNYRDIAGVPEALRPQLPRSYDVIGDVAILKFSKELLGYEGAIGDALLRANRHLQTIAVDAGVCGHARQRSLRVIAGRESMLTIHREHGARLWIEPSRVYFSPRLAEERMRIARLVKKGERVIDMFAGAGPYSIIIAMHSSPGEVHAIDSNPDAVALMRRNIALNKVAVHPYLGDARSVIPWLGNADRIIMNLPHTAHSYLDTALGVASPGTVMHLYQHVTKGEIAARGERLLGTCRELGASAELQRTRVIHPYSSRSDIVVYDISVLGAS